MPLITDLPAPPWADRDEATILALLLASIDPAFNVDQGDFIYDSLAPAATELAKAYGAMTISLGLTFLATATGAQLDLLAENFGRGIARLTDETDDQLRARLQARLEAPAGAGNIADYKTWALEVAGVGWVTVTANWSGAGTVRVSIASSARAAASGGLLADVTAYIATKSPTGATVTVDTITITTVAVAVDVTLEVGFSLDSVMEQAIEDAVADYFNTLGPGDDVVRFDVARYVMAVPGVFDIATLTLDASATNKAIDADKLAAANTTVT